jgi:tetratricopeptide (TPR) repeat protein
VSFQPDITSVLQNLANVYFDRGDLENALPIYQLLASNAQSSTHYYNLGVVYKQLNDLSAAEEIFELARDLAPQDAETLLRLAEVFYEKKAFQRTMGIYREIINIDPEHVLTHYNLGTLLVQENRSEEAVAVFQKAVRIVPHDQEMQLALALAYETANRVDEAVKLYREILAQDPENQVALQRLNLYR